MDFLVRVDRMESNMQDTSLAGVADLLNERESIADLSPIRNLELDEHVFTHCVREQIANLANRDLQIHG
jgi:hypothetical protein